MPPKHAKISVPQLIHIIPRDIYASPQLSQNSIFALTLLYILYFSGQVV